MEHNPVDEHTLFLSACVHAHVFASQINKHHLGVNAVSGSVPRVLEEGRMPLWLEFKKRVNEVRKGGGRKDTTSCPYCRICTLPTVMCETLEGFTLRDYIV